jgi:hypothetical protein
MIVSLSFSLADWELPILISKTRNRRAGSRVAVQQIASQTNERTVLKESPYRTRGDFRVLPRIHIKLDLLYENGLVVAIRDELEESNGAGTWTGIHQI